MKTFKISTIIITVIAIFSSCKKENITKQRDVKDFTSTNMKMNYYGKILEYTIKYSPSTNQVKVEGKDAEQFNEITKKYKNPVALYTSEYEITFYNTTDEYYAYVFRNMINKPQNRIIKNEETTNLVYQQIVTTQLYEHINGVNLLRTSNFDNFNIGTYYNQNFTVYQKCGNDNTDNWCSTNYSVSTLGVKETWVSDRDNDKYSSFRTTDTRIEDNQTYPSPITFNQYNWMQIVFFQDVNYGGKAIGFNKPLNIGWVLYVPDLRTKAINAYGSTWNDRISSFYQFFTL